MDAPLRVGLLFCLSSFLFGGAAAFFAELLRAIFISLRLLTCKREKNKISPRVVIGFFFYDILLFTSLASFYMIFLFVANEGILRIHSVLLALLGFFLLRPLARKAFYPVERILSWIFALPFRLLRFFLERLSRKKRKRLDEDGKMV